VTAEVYEDLIGAVALVAFALALGSAAAVW
jgi:hypothetical protein